MNPASKLYIWRNHALFLTDLVIPVRSFTIGADQLLVCLKGSIRRQINEHAHVTFKSALLRAGTKIPMSEVSSDAAIALFHLNPISQDYHAIKEQMALPIENIAYHHAQEEQIISELTSLKKNNLCEQEAYNVFKNIITPASVRDNVFFKFDDRVISVLEHIQETVRDNISIEDMAARVFISESRLVKLFKSQVGVSITRYRLRYRVFVGTLYISQGASVTEAALAAGFASTAHFSKCFSAMIGAPPSAQFLRRPYLEVILANEFLKMSLKATA